MKKLLMVFVAVLISSVSNASYLWFGVSNNDDGYSNVSSYMSALGLTFDQVYVRVMAKQGDTAATEIGSAGLSSAWETDDNTIKDIDTYGSAYTYYIEIATSQDGIYNPVGYSKAVTYAQLSSHISSSMTEIPTADAWHGSGYRATPEPTSALLMLLGVAGLALKRKQRVA